jgi:hypothetical protein
MFIKIRGVLTLLACLFLFATCEESQNYAPLRKIDGVWKISSLRYYDITTNKDSLVYPQNATLTFNSCTKEENKRPTNCGLTYDADGVSFPFTYQVTDDDRLGINGGIYTGPLQREFIQTEKVLNGGYQIQRLDNERLILFSRKDCDATTGRPEQCRYQVEIDAVKIQ